MNDLKDVKFILTVMAVVISTVINFTTMSVNLSHLQKEASEHVRKSEYEIRMSYHEIELANHKKALEQLMIDYPAWKAWHEQNKSK